MLILCAALGAPPEAYAHAEVVRSRPGNGEQLLHAPAAVVIDYSEGVQLIQAAVIDAGGQPVDLLGGQIRPGATTVVDIPLRDGLADGLYTVRWQALADDGHTTRGAFFFMVGTEPLTRDRFLALLDESAAAERSEVSPVDPLARGALFLALMVLVGAPLTHLLLVLPAMRGAGVLVDYAGRSVHRLLIGAALLMLIASTLLALGQNAAQGTPLPEFATGTTLGRSWLLRLGLGAGLLALFALVSAPRLSRLAAVGAGLVGQASISATSHSASYVPGPAALLADLGHLVGGALWAGGLLVLAVVLPMTVEKLATHQAVAVTERCIHRFSVVAISGLGLTIGSGLLLTSWHVPIWSALPGTAYGVVLLAKSGGVLLAISLGALNRLLMLRRITRAVADANASQVAILTLARTVRAELAVVVAVFALSGLLTSLATATIAAGQQAARAPLLLMGEVRGVDVGMAIRPYQVGLNVFDVAFVRDGQPVADIRDVALLLRLPDEQILLPQVRLEPTGPGTFSALGSFTLHGQWQVRASAEIEGRFTAKTFDVELASERRLVPDPTVAASLRWGAAAVGVLAALALAFELSRYRISRKT